MHRKYDTARFLESVELLHRYFPGCAVTTDLIVGFPGETEQEFAASLAFMRRCALSQVHIFPYSRRKGTPAASMTGQLTSAEKAARAEQAAQVAQELEAAYRQAMVRSTQKVLFEQPEGAYMTGHAENYVKVYVKAADDAALHNTVRSVRVLEPYADGVLGELL